MKKGILEKIRIEPMKEDDLMDVMRIEKASFPIPWSESSFLYELRENTEVAYLRVARLSSGGYGPSSILGYVCFWILYRETHIMNLAVHPEWRRQGIGESLIRASLKEAKEKGCLRASLEVRTSNLAAIRLYEKLGFTQRAIRRNYYDSPREDAVVMWLYDLSRFE